jgi:hypothetical protein
MIEHIEQGTLAPNIHACIALTSWKKRINTVGLTIYNLFETCGPDYHIVLTLAEEEFPRKEQELPRDLVLMNRAGIFEILWVRSNTNCFKKLLPTMCRYSGVPVISVDDGQIYTKDVATELFEHYMHNNKAIYAWRTVKYGTIRMPVGCAGILYPPTFPAQFAYSLLNNTIIKTFHDDAFIGVMAKMIGINIVNVDDTYSNPFIVLPDMEMYGITLNNPTKDKKMGLIIKQIMETLSAKINELEK